MASTVDASHFPLALPPNEPSLASACWISEIRSGVGTVCPRSRLECRVFLLRGLPAEEAGAFPAEAVFAPAEASYTTTLAATSSASPIGMALRARIVSPLFVTSRANVQ